VAGAAAGVGASAGGLIPGGGTSGVSGAGLSHLVSSGGGADNVDNLVTPDNPPGPLGGGIAGLPGHGELGAAPPADYHPHVDVDGDGRWDQYQVSGRTDGGVDVTADMDHDGRVDFVGHDDNRDGFIDRTDYDKDHDGVLETHMTDMDGDGWMDRTVIDPTGQGLRPAD
jgi:hypothetical protein